MPPKYVATVRQLILWQYAQLIATAAGFEGNYAAVAKRLSSAQADCYYWRSPSGAA
jgi:hypothetical protein